MERPPTRNKVFSQTANPYDGHTLGAKLPITFATLEVTREGMRLEIHDLGGD
jgi:uncharacterized protein